jgi:hypothetical protein
VGALKNRNVIRRAPGAGVAVIYEWTELGLRMLLSLHAATPERIRELREQIRSVPVGDIPPLTLRDLPETKPVAKDKQIDMVEATTVNTSAEAKAQD